MSGFAISLHGVVAQVTAEDALVASLDELRRDFEHLVVSELPGYPELQFRLSASPPELGGPGRRLFSTELCQVHGLGSKRACDYGEGTWCVSRFEGNARIFEVHSPDHEFAREIAYTAILSALGEALDLKGIHRIHALGFEHEERARGILVLPPGGGKSSLAACMLRDSEFRIYSDESPLLCQKRGQVSLHGFPIRIALAPPAFARWMEGGEAREFRRRIYGVKKLFPIPREKLAQPAPLTHLMIGRPAGPGAKPRIFPCSRITQAAELAKSIVGGLGLAQMAEHLVRVDRTHTLAPIAARRARLAARLLAMRAWVFEVSEDANANLEVLREHLRNKE